jgi:HAD superfamily hydrolase (TIGR01549 family)
MVVHAVLFDLDDTLYDHRHARLAGLRKIRAMEPALERFPLAQLDRSLEQLLTEIHVSLVLTGKISREESRRLRMARFLAEYRLALPRRRVRELVDARVEEYQRHRRAVPGAPALLRRLHSEGVTVGVVTNNLVAEQTEKLQLIGLDPFVDFLICSEEVGVTKPHPRIFRFALKRTGARPETAVMVGDSWESDVLGAARAGIPAVWFHRDSLPLPAHPPAKELRSFRPLDRAHHVILEPRRRARRRAER